MEYTTLEIISFIVLLIAIYLFFRWMIRFDAKEDERNSSTRYKQAEKCKPYSDGDDMLFMN